MMRLEDIDDSFYVENDVNGIVTYYLDPELTKPYTGVIYNKWQGKIESEAEFIDGLKNGLEHIYNEDGEPIQINECRGNVMFGITKEFQKGYLTSVSIVYNNSYIKSLDVNRNKEIIDIQKNYYDVTKGDKIPEGDKILTNMSYERLPKYIRMLLELSDKELVEYEFKRDNPYLKPPYNI
ncbi:MULTISPECIES: hypothetical protein [Myroides]|uniref:Uncharacterized protein n=1 Tax=Myroides albus TaxID=2562892 RepID=A0A6I3LRA1_9FLAO|nr:MULTISPECIES: hypothetical protein [Myroides]MTG99211.1 hypothetical protein [Myroides albus]MVX37221.1 hypothetical protein [Myroides sp. LoEW2-1]UVD78669.1 hypothetical protein NWE55_11115 [Myroides albus]